MKREEEKEKRMTETKARLLTLIKEKALKIGSVTLSSGKTSDWYLDLRLITLDSLGAYLVAESLYNLLKDEKFDSLGGLTIGADPICGAFCVVSHQHKKPITSFIVRKKVKSHGQAKLIEGPLKKGAKVIIVDDVATSGGSLLQAINAVEIASCTVVKAAAVIDRCEGAKENLAKHGHELVSIFNKEDFFL